MLKFHRSLISQIFNRSQKYFNENFWHAACSVRVQRIRKIISAKSSQIAIHENLDPQKFSAIQYYPLTNLITVMIQTPYIHTWSARNQLCVWSWVPNTSWTTPTWILEYSGYLMSSHKNSPHYRTMFVLTRTQILFEEVLQVYMVQFSTMLKPAAMECHVHLMIPRRNLHVQFAPNKNGQAAIHCTVI